MQKQINVNPATLKNHRCKCGCLYWENIIVIKFVPALLAGASEPFPLQINLLRCMECKEVMPEALKLIKEPEETKLLAS